MDSGQEDTISSKVPLVEVEGFGVEGSGGLRSNRLLVMRAVFLHVEDVSERKFKIGNEVHGGGLVVGGWWLCLVPFRWWGVFVCWHGVWVDGFCLGMSVEW